MSLRILGQEEVSRFLESRLDSLPSTMLFCGPEGSGKSSTGHELAREIDYRVIEIYPDGDSFKTKQVRDILKLYRENTKIVFILNDVDKLTGAASSLLLKSLEDPKPEVIFILTAKEYAQVSYTLYSRCVMLEFNSVTQDSLKEYLQEKYNVWNEHYAKIANGSFKMADNVASGSYIAFRNQVWGFLSEIKYLNEDSLLVPEVLKSDTEFFISTGLNLIYDIIKVHNQQRDLVVNADLMDELDSWLDRYSFDFAVFVMICFREILKNMSNFYNIDLHLKTLVLKLKLGSVPI